jgi:geranylgeranyl diphosphate synthase, type II
MSIYTKELVNFLSQESEKLKFGSKPEELYEPLRYIMALGGKRMRPVLTLFSYSLFKDDYHSILKPALAVEVFHNFTLLHDDIMDRAPLRRGKATVHEKWNENIAILSGDVMLVKAYELFMDLEPIMLKRVLQSFNKTAAEVCEGQQLDMNFEKLSKVTEEEYLEMIKLKTAVLLGFSLELGALLAGTSEQNALLLKEIGINTGIGFQLKDDLLDVYADQEKFGKQVGGDIIANKKTFLLIEALEKADEKKRAELLYWLGLTNFNKEHKVKAVTSIYDSLNIKEITEQKMNAYFNEALNAVRAISASEEKKELLYNFIEDLIKREN